MRDENQWQCVSLMSILEVQICYKRRTSPSEKEISTAQPKGPAHVNKPNPKNSSKAED